MKKMFSGFWFSLPVQLFMLHFRKYQVILLFWYILFATVGGHFMRSFGADSLFLAPEYLGKANALSTAIVGFAMGIFIMSWNITTFILHSRHVKFLATTAQPFLKYCINNAIIPLLFLAFYSTEAYDYVRYRELLSSVNFFVMISGFLGGMILSVMIGFIYFFGADKTIYRQMASVMDTANLHYSLAKKENILPQDRPEIRVEWFLSARLRFRKPRDIRHYSQSFLDSVFKRHHFSAVIAIFIAFVFLIGIGYISDSRLFELPAAASITILFAVLIAAAGAFATFLRNWSIPVLILIFWIVNLLYQYDVIDGRNKAYGLNYIDRSHRPTYSKSSVIALASDSNIAADKAVYIKMLNAWKARQKDPNPILYIINTSGGGLRSASFTMHVLQQLDSMMQGNLMHQTILINGASGGMLGAAYFRELYLQKKQGADIDLQNPVYVNNISKDLLSPLFSSFVSRDILGPAKRFSRLGYTYTKDRGYAFEERLNENTQGALNKTLEAYADAEAKAAIPLMFFNAVITRDGRKMIMATHPARFLMRPVSKYPSNIGNYDADAIDFRSFFAKQNAGNLSILSALRMNATFPYVLPNVWLPTSPVIDVMDTGLRDNFGQETSLRFIEVFKEWLKANTAKVVIIQIRDRILADWSEPTENSNLINIMINPFLSLQHNWYKIQSYYQQDQLQYESEAYGPDYYRICFQYIPSRKEVAASLSFHLTEAEKRDIPKALEHSINQQEFKRLKKIISDK